MVDTDYAEGSYRFCSCGWDGDTTKDHCPDCGAEWFMTPEGEINGF